MIEMTHVISGKELARLMALTGGIAQAHVALQRSLVRLENRYGCLAKWFVVQRSTARGAKVRLLVKPTQITTDLLAAGLALCENEHGVKGTAGTKQLLNLLRSDFHKTSMNARARDSGRRSTPRTPVSAVPAGVLPPIRGYAESPSATYRVGIAALRGPLPFFKVPPS